MILNQHSQVIGTKKNNCYETLQSLGKNVFFNVLIYYFESALTVENVFFDEKSLSSPIARLGVRSGEQEVTGSILGHDIPKLLKMVLAAPHLALYGVELGPVHPVSG